MPPLEPISTPLSNETDMALLQSIKSMIRAHPQPEKSAYYEPFARGKDFADQVEEWAAQYQSAAPFPHIVLDGLFDTQYLKTVLAEVPSPLTDSELFNKDVAHLQERKYAFRDIPRMTPRVFSFVNILNSKPFVEFLEKLTGITGLVPDAHMWGAGFHQIMRGGKLAIHADFNIHPATGMQRRLNILLYLNEGWKAEWGGELELWNTDMSSCAKRISPMMNRFVVFNTTGNSYHGHPEPLSCPESVIRRSLALYYYSMPVAQPEKHSTLWQKRPQDDIAVALAAEQSRRDNG